MVIADADRLIRGLDCVWPGCTHDARSVDLIVHYDYAPLIPFYCPNHLNRVWNNSEERVILEGQSTAARLAEQLGNGPGAVFCVAGDSAYPLSNFLLKKFKVIHCAVLYFCRQSFACIYVLCVMLLLSLHFTIIGTQN